MSYACGVFATAIELHQTLLVFAVSEHDHETFESADAGASLTYPQQAGTIRKNGFMVAKGRPCKVRLGCGRAARLP